MADNLPPSGGQDGSHPKNPGASSTRKPRLGRGLSSLMSTAVRLDADGADIVTEKNAEIDAESTSAEQGSGPKLQYLTPSSIIPNPYQPRQDFDAATIASLADSIRQDGLMQPILVRRSHQGQFEIVAGERRWRAAREAGLEHIPAVVHDLDDRQLAEWAVIENLQREDLDAIEQAAAFKRLTEEFQLTHDQLAQRLSVSRTHITNSMRLLELEYFIQDAIRTGALTAGHGRALLSQPDPQTRSRLAQQAINEAWSVRFLEQTLKSTYPSASTSPSGATAQPTSSRTTKPVSAHMQDLEKQISEHLKTRVRLKPGRKKGSGALTIEFYSLDEFDALLQRLGITLE